MMRAWILAVVMFTTVAPDSATVFVTTRSRVMVISKGVGAAGSAP